MSFVPLQVLSSYSLLNSPIRIKELVQTAKERGYQTLALTDTNVMYGAIEFYEACLNAKIKPLIGLNILIDDENGLDNQFSLVLVAKNFNGYQNLLKISSKKMTLDDAQKFHFSDLSEYLDDVLTIIPPVRSELNELLERGLPNAAQKLLVTYKEKLGNDLLIGVNLHATNIMQQTLLQMAKTSDLKCVALPQVEYLNAEDHFATQVLRDIDSGETINHPEILIQNPGDNWLKPSSTFEADFKKAGLEQLVQNLNEAIIDIDVQIPLVQPKLPEFQTPGNISSKEYLSELCKKGINRIPAFDERYQERLSHELDVINSMGFSDYFLIIHDVIEFAHQNQIITGPGRGSAAGSLVAYLLGITSVDPIQYGLLFERFLNPDRAQMPDIDLDIPDDKRDIILQYVHEKYGNSHVAQIITFGTLAAKQSIRDVARVFGEMPNKINQISKLIPSELNITLKKAYEKSIALRDFVKQNARNKLIFETASKLEGLPRHYSIHAAGVVISKYALTDNAPVQMGSEGLLVSQYSKNYVERVGLLKMDFLGLRNLTLMADIVGKVRKSEPEFDIEKIDLNDSNTLNIFKNADTSGIFQFESPGIRNVLRKVAPDKFSLVVAVNALYRPGPMENIDSFVKRKNGLENYRFPNEVLKNILGETFGILVYQEQVMEVASAMGGLSMGQADSLRRAMSKKKLDVIETMREEFVSGAIKKGFSEKIAIQVYKYIENFANYGFNKSHAVAYSKLAFQLAYLKAHYPGDFYTSLLNSAIGNEQKIKLYLSELKQLGINVLAPNINLSMADFTYYQKQVLFGFNAIKGLRHDFIRELLEKRTENGPFKSVDDLLRRLGRDGINVEIIEKLVYSGALDSFGYNRAELIEFVPELLQGIQFSGDNVSLFEKLMPTIKRRPDLSLDEKLIKEEELLGSYVSVHPVQRFNKFITEHGLNLISNLMSDQNVDLIAYVRKYRTIRTKKGDEMAFLTISDETGEAEAVIFPSVFKRYKDLKAKSIIRIEGKTETRNSEIQILVNKISKPNSVAKIQKKYWRISVPSRKNNPEMTKKLYNVFNEFHGNTPVVLFYEDTQKEIKLNQKFWLQDNKQAKEALARILGTEKFSLVLSN